MASKQLKGITIDIGGNTTKLTEALKDVNKESTSLKTELKEVEKGLKLDPKNTVLLQQKQELLKQSVTNTSKELEVLEEAQKQVNEQFKKGEVGKDTLRAIQREVQITKIKLNGLKDDVVTPFDKMETAITKVEHASKKAGKAVLKIGKVAGKAGGLTVKAFRGMGTAIAGAGTALAGGALAAVESTEELRGDLSKLEQNAKTSGHSFDGLKNELKTLTAITGETDSSIEGLSNLMATPLSSEQLKEAVDGLTGAVIKFPDTLKFESLSDSLQETLATGEATGQFGELLERSGQSLDKFNESMEKAKNSSERSKIALKALADTGLADVSKEYKEANKDALGYKESQMEMQMQIAELAEKVLPVVNEAMGLFNGVIGKAIDPISELLDAFVDMVSGVEGSSDRFAELVINLLDSAVQTIIDSIPKFVSGFADILSSLVSYLADGDTITSMVLGFVDMFTTIVDELLPKVPKIMWELGKALVTGLWDGIKSLSDWLWEKITGFGDWVVDGFKDIFGIHSPSKVMKEEVGKYLAEGIGEGMTDYDFGSPEVEVMQNVTRNINTSANSSGVGGGLGTESSMSLSQLVDAIANRPISLVCEGREIARVVDRYHANRGLEMLPGVK